MNKMKLPFIKILFLWVLLTAQNMNAGSSPQLSVGSSYVLSNANGNSAFEFEIRSLSSPNSGTGKLYIPMLGQSVDVYFDQFFALNSRGNWKGRFKSVATDQLKYRIEAQLNGQYFDLQSMPLHLNELAVFSRLNLQEHQLWMTDLYLDEKGLSVALALSVQTPEGHSLIFHQKNIMISGDSPDFCGMSMWLEDPVNTNDPEFPITIKGSVSDLDSASYIEFNCDGFERFQLFCEYRFPRSILIPVNPNKERVSAYFKIVSVKIGDFIGSVTVDPFEVNGVDDFQFEITSATVDYSTLQNEGSMLAAIDPAWPAGLKSVYNNSTWRGFFLESLKIKLPEGFGASSGNRLSVEILNVLADHGNGVTGTINVQPGLSGNIEGWGISLNSLILKIVANSPHEFSLNGGINIPIMTGTSQYTAVVSFPSPAPPNTPPVPRKANINLTLSLDGTYTLPFLNECSLVLQNGSSAGISYTDGKFIPEAVFHGSLNVALNNPAITFPSLNFENFKINDRTLSAAVAQGGQVTGGLDKISVGAFGFGGIMIAGSGGSSSSALPASGGSAGAPIAAPASSGSSPQNQTLAGFPIYVRNIKFGSATDQGQSCYKLDFTIGVNFASGSNAFNTSGMFAIWGNLDFGKLLSSTPWQTVSFRKISVEGITVEADLGKIKIAGGLRLINDDPVYGSGFKGAIKMDVKLPSAEFFVQCLGQFGSLKAQGNTPAYRYFFVDAIVGFGNGLAIGNTGLSFYGFSGGFFYNMEKTGQSAEDVAKGLNPATAGSNTAPDLNSGNLLQPGVALSGATYVPRLNVTSFQVGLVMGMAAPQTLLADVQFGMEFNTGNGFAVQRIFFEGGAYAMNKGVSDRQNAAVVSRLRLDIDLNNNTLVGNFGANVSAPFGVPANLAIVRGTYNMNLMAVNIFFEFTGTKRFFVKVGTPTNPMQVSFQLSSAIQLGNINAYFMMGNSLDPIPTIAQIFSQEGYNLPSSFQALANRSFLSGDQGIAFGARLKIAPRPFSFLIFSASFRAMAGFDASMMRFNTTPTCGSNGTFGMNNWYLQGQAYAAFYGALHMRINLFFYKGRVKIAEIEAGAALMAQLPNPSYMMGFLYGRYAVLGGRVKGSFRFKVEMGTKCADLPDYNPVANIPLISDVKPETGSRLEIYESPVATFFLPMGQMMSFSVPKDDGSEELRTYQCFIKEMSIRKKSNNALIPGQIIYQDTFSTAILEQSQLLEPNTTYIFKIRAGWHEWRGSTQVSNNAEEFRTVEFTTGGLPNRIVKEAVGYHSPGFKQRYWHSNYAKPMLEFKQSGWDFLFPGTKAVSFVTSDKSIENAFKSVGWSSTGAARQISLLPYHPTFNPYVSWRISHNIQVKYIMRLTNTRTNEKIDRDLNGYPGTSFDFEHPSVQEKGFADNFSNLFKVKYVTSSKTNGKQVIYDALNSLTLNKKDIYHLEIVRIPLTPVRLPVSSNNVDQTAFEITPQGDTLASVETQTRTISPIQASVANISAQLAEEVMYKDYYFGVSEYNSLADKYNAAQHSTTSAGINRSDFGHPETRLLKVKWGYSSKDAYYSFSSPLEPFDKFDQIKLRTNIQQIKTAEHNAPVYDHVYFNRKPKVLAEIIASGLPQAGRQIYMAAVNKMNGINSVERTLHSNNITYDLYNPYYIMIANIGLRISNKSGFFTHGSETPSFWFDLNGNKLNDASSKASGASKFAYQQWQDFVNAITQPNYNVADWSMQLHFNTHFPDTLTNTEISNKSIRAYNSSTWGSYTPAGMSSSISGQNALVVQDLQARIARNLLQFYFLDGEIMQIMFMFGGKNLRISPDYFDLYKLLGSYYSRSMTTQKVGKTTYIYNSASWKGVWNDVYDLNASKINAAKLGITYKQQSTAPLYMHTKVGGTSHNKSVNILKAVYNKQ